MIGAPKITPDMVEANIASSTFIKATDRLTICLLTLRSGYVVTGESACAVGENYDKALGERFSRANAVEKVWPLMGYALRERMHQEKAVDFFDPLTTAQEALAIAMSNGIADGRRADPVALLEFADKLYAARAR